MIRLRFDRYESKMAYWVEEDLEAEYTKHRSRTTEETHNHQVERDAIDAIVDSSAPLQLDARDARAATGSVLFSCLLLEANLLREREQYWQCCFSFMQ